MSLSNTYAFAVDPTTGIFYAIDFSNNRYSVSSDGSYIYLDTVTLPAEDDHLLASDRRRWPVLDRGRRLQPRLRRRALELRSSGRRHPDLLGRVHR